MLNWHSHLLQPDDNRSHVWRGILKACTTDIRVWNLFFEACSMKIGNGGLALLWHDSWALDKCFKLLYPQLFALSAAPNAIVCDRMNIQWRRHLRTGTEVSMFQTMKAEMELVCLDPDQSDLPTWKRKVNGYSSHNFTVLWHATYANHSYIFPFKIIWSSLALPKVKFFCWLAIRHAIPCSDFLVSRGVNLIFGRHCMLCMTAVEDADHTILHCPIAWNFWNWFFRKLNLPWTMPRNLSSFLLAWFDLFKCHRYSALWNLIGMNILWFIWKYRNRRVFHDTYDDVNSLIFTCILESVAIFKAYSSEFCYSVKDVYRELGIIFAFVT